jgi:transposase
MSRPIGTAAELERRRRRAVELVRQGERPTVIARVFGVARPSVYRWQQLAEQAPDGLAAKPHPGRAMRLSQDQLRHLETLLQQGACAHGWQNDLWTTARVAALIQRHFGVSFHHDHVGRFLRRRLNWTPQKPRRRARERDEEAIARWKQQEFPRIVRETRRRRAHLVFLDESGFLLTPSVRRTWGPRGHTPILDAWDRRDRISAISSITVSPRRGRLNLYFQLLPKNANVHGADIVSYLRHLKEQLPGPLTILWDGSATHDRSHLVRAFLAEHPAIVSERLPAYAPEVNPDELVWSWTKYGRLANLAAWNTDWLYDHVIESLYYLRKHPQLLASFIKHTNLPLRC